MYICPLVPSVLSRLSQEDVHVAYPLVKTLKMLMILKVLARACEHHADVQGARNA
jgi:hypothetical protein